MDGGSLAGVERPFAAVTDPSQSELGIYVVRSAAHERDPQPPIRRTLRGEWRRLRKSGVLAR